ncbi:hypothetical protein R5R35_002235 [Gryllus longicercus]|uniref:U8 snoRNA-decapping enzyme n=2 Tax=Gryllus longicercus TaxID=2509291 RepID=A0AAN9VQG8_9ORTH
MFRMSNIDDGSWGHLADTEHFGRKTSSSDVRVISYNETTHPKYVNYTKAGHCMIYSKQNEKMFGLYDTRAAVLMQMRFDGYIGFPGGLIDDGENTVSGVNRELVEEINFDLEKFTIKEEHHVISHVNEKLKLILHFFAIEVPLQDFEEMEKKSLSAHDYGNEVMGIVRIPLYTMGDGFRGFPAFLTNAFAGNSREQLLQSLIQRQIMTKEEIERALEAKAI